MSKAWLHFRKKKPQFIWNFSARDVIGKKIRYLQELFHNAPGKCHFLQSELESSGYNPTQPYHSFILHPQNIQ